MELVKGVEKDFKPRPTHKILEGNFARFSKSVPAVIFKTAVPTYSELNFRANKYAQVIFDLATRRPLDRDNFIIAVGLSPSEKLIEVLLAIWKVGAAYLPIDPSFPRARIDYILEEARPALLIYETVDAPLNANKIHISSLDQMADRLPEQTFSSKDSSLAIVMYTSGSTGKPKGVRITHKQILNRLSWQFETFPYLHNETHCVFKTALTFVDSVCEIWGPLMSGVSLVILPKSVSQNPELLVRELEEYKIQRLVLVPSLLQAILTFLKIQSNPRCLENLKTWFCSGEALRLSLAEEFFHHFDAGTHRLCNLYGSTEVMGDVTSFTIHGKDDLKGLQKIPIGRPIHNTGIILLDEDQKPVKPGDVGEIFVSGLNVSEGYLNSEGEGKFLTNPFSQCQNHQKLFKTGDFGFFKDGLLFYEGRTDSQVKIRGHRVDLAEVDAAVLALKGVLEVVVLCQSVTDLDRIIVAFVKLSDNFTVSGLKEKLRTLLPDYMLPEIVKVDSFPLLTNGKVDRQALLKRFRGDKPPSDGAGLTEKAEILFKIIADVLGARLRGALDISNNFFDIGGNSLNTVQVVAELLQRGLKISVTDFLNAKNLGEIFDRLVEVDPSSKVTEEETLKFLKYKAVPLESKHKNICVQIVSEGFAAHSPFNKYTNAQKSDFEETVLISWDFLLEANLSFVVEDEAGKVVGVALNHDAQDEPDLTIENRLSSILEIVHHVETPVRKNELPQGYGQTLMGLCLATHKDLRAQENVKLVFFIERENIKLAERKGFSGILTDNASPLTQQLAIHLLGYKTLLRYPVNAFVNADGKRPFEEAPDSLVLELQYKDLSKPSKGRRQPVH